MTLSHVQLRKLFKDFWEKRDHREVPPISLVPQNDPTTLFTGSGMQQLVPYLLGEPHPLGKKLFNIQPCFRSQDIEEIGDNRHTTFFEMMGNWSLGTYFKKEQLTWFWEFLTKELELPKEKLYVSVFAGTKDIPEDKESIEIWKSLGIPEERIFKYGADKNWWSRAGEPDKMPTGEPGGPDSEVFYEFTHVPHTPQNPQNPHCHPNCECGRFLEIGNSVFMEYKKLPNGTFQELPAKNVDFGGGLERILAALNNNPDVFKVDVIWPIVKKIEQISSKNYGNDPTITRAMRILADHMRSSVIIAANGIMPSNKDQGYFLRRLLRRMIRYGKLIGIDKEISVNLVKVTANIFHNTYSEFLTQEKKIEKTFAQEENKFFNLLTNIKPYIDKSLQDIFINPYRLSQTAFEFFQSFGYPPEMYLEDAKEAGIQIKDTDFWSFYQSTFNQHREISKRGAEKKFKGGLADQSEQTIKYHTATHLIHQALFDVLGNEIRQEGSNITAERLRFDYYSPIKPTPEQIKQIETIINDKIKQSLPVEFKILPKEEANKLGAKSFFREKYPDMVKVYFVGDYSKEFCGGPHVKNTFEIGQISIFKFEKIGSNLYRIYAK